MSRVALAGIPALTFYKDELTAAKRSDPVQQLTCIGKACQLYTPDVVRCTNIGGSGTDVDWKCEADLPEALRFGRVQVSCEGWEGPGDPYVLKGSCGLEYRLVEVPNALRHETKADGNLLPSRLARWYNRASVGDIAFTILWTAILVLMLYSLFKSCFSHFDRSRRSGGNPPNPPGGGGHGGSWYTLPASRGPPPGSQSDPPPSYSKTAPNTQSQSSSDSSSWGNYRPGFWTGAALGSLATGLYNRAREGNPDSAGVRPQQPDRAYDWERERVGARGIFRDEQRYTTPVFSSPRRPTRYDSVDRGEGSSTGLGSMRRSTGYGGSSVR